MSFVLQEAEASRGATGAAESSLVLQVEVTLGATGCQ
jgi:hypothetical protein